MRSRPLLLAALLSGCSAGGGVPAPAAILLFNGTGTSPNDVRAVEILLEKTHVDFATANSHQLNRLSETGLHPYRLLIVPGGNFVEIGNSLSSGTDSKII